MKFGEILSKAWKTIWKHKILWLFGILAGCSASGSGRASSNVNYSTSSNGYQDMPSFLGPEAQHSAEQFFRSLADVQAGVWVLVGVSIFILILAISFLSLMASTLGTTGVIKGTSMADQAAEDDKPLSFGMIFKGLKPHFWKVLLMTLIVNIGGFILGVILVIPILILTVCTFFLAGILMIPLGWFITTLVRFTTIAIVEENLGIIDAVKRAWNLLIKNLGNVAIMFLILGVGGTLLSMFLAIPIILSLLPVIINITSNGIEAVRGGVTLTLIFFAIALPIVIFLGGVLKAYVLSAWTLTYREITAETPLDPEVISLPKEKKEKS
ncbi:hypothetical protein JR338_11515 [Chloroflexota bacterium]|nr:hypothetical protein JR338_11515 [Chloroflexota bacterium]